MSEVRLVKTNRERFERMHIDALSKPWLAADQSIELGLERMGKRIGKSRQKHSRLRVCARHMHRAVQRNDGFSGARRAGNTSRSRIVPIHPLTLLRVKKYRPFFPGKIERLFQLLDIRHYAETALCVGVLEWIADW